MLSVNNMKKQALYTVLFSAVGVSLLIYWFWSPLVHSLFDQLVLMLLCMTPFVVFPFVLLEVKKNGRNATRS